MASEPNVMPKELRDKAVRDGELLDDSSSTHSSSILSDHAGASNDRTDTTRDLEKQETARSQTGSDMRRRVTRTQSLRGETQPFYHPLSHVKTGQDVVVDFDGPDDPYRPMNWPIKKKVVTTLLYGLTTMGSTWASSVYSPAIFQVADEFQVSREVSTLGLSFLLIGFGLGPLIWAPCSEIYGRRSAVLAPYFIALCFTFGTATAKDIQTVLITRFFAGFFGSAPVTNTGGVLSDIWHPTQRGTALVGYAMAVVGGPVIGPIVGGAIVQSYLRWRWTEYITGIMQISILIADVIILDETYPPVLLSQKAQRLRHDTGNYALHARHEEWDVSVGELVDKFGKRPLKMLMTPICFFVALYASFVYGILYLNLSAFPIEFQETRGWNQVVGALPFLTLFIGILGGAFINVFNTKRYNKVWIAAGSNKPVPEARLPPMMVGSVAFAAGLFLFGWTSSPKIHWVFPNIGAALLGFGFFTIFQCALNYLIDTFQTYAASAIAANTFLRSMFAAAFPLFSTYMYGNLGIPWASSLLGFIAVALIPIPYVFYFYGPSIRKLGKYSADVN